MIKFGGVMCVYISSVYCNTAVCAIKLYNNTAVLQYSNDLPQFGVSGVPTVNADDNRGESVPSSTKKRCMQAGDSNNYVVGNIVMNIQVLVSKFTLDCFCVSLC